MKTIRLFFVAAWMALCGTLSSQATHSFTVADGTFQLDGKPFTVRAAELHYPRIPRPYWEHRIRMCKALGMNTICIYVFWNVHEQREGQFDFTGQNDVAHFCRLAQKHGMWVIVRPGPYVCAEWEMGGLPWWLLKKPNIGLRQLDPYFMERVREFEKRVGQQLAPLTIERGGPIIMVQVENEYGSFGTNRPYVSQIRDIIRQEGFEHVTLFQCDWATNFENNALPDLLWTMNFGTGSDVDEQFRRLGELRPTTPKMCSEYWSGWFDKWGAQHETRPADDMVAGIDQMLRQGISFSLYMTHGGTSFGHWAGANSPGYAPDVTSYDYDAPINEHGQPTHKFWLLRETLQRHTAQKLPDVPASPMPVIDIPEFHLTEYAPLEAGIARTVNSSPLRTMEDLDMGWGTIIYRTTLPAIETPSTLTVNQCHDYGRVFVDSVQVGTIDRRLGQSAVTLPPSKQGAQLTIMVEGMGRINFGQAIADRKGITHQVTITTADDADIPLTLWDISLIPDDYECAINALSKTDKTTATLGAAGYYRGYFDLDSVGDTFLCTEHFGKGQVYVNGHPLGRFWSIGPQQTLYLPGCWLQKGRNEVIVLDVNGTDQPTLFGQRFPVLNRLILATGNEHRTDPASRPSLPAPASQGVITANSGWQQATLPQAVTGRYLAVELTTDDVHGAALAEMVAYNAKSERMPCENWATRYVSSEDIVGGNHTADKAFDQQESTHWSGAQNNLPQLLVIDMGTRQTVGAVGLLLPNAHTASYRLFIFD
ncbi:MAG: beta-galactosidase [Muribaculaceae bacterium]|nr:beta-galactosidase [Muribaculaceae bacterium]